MLLFISSNTNDQKLHCSMDSVISQHHYVKRFNSLWNNILLGKMGFTNAFLCIPIEKWIFLVYPLLINFLISNKKLNLEQRGLFLPDVAGIACFLTIGLESYKFFFKKQKKIVVLIQKIYFVVAAWRFSLYHW